MTDLAVRAVLVAALAAAAAGAGLAVTRRRGATQPRARVERLGFDVAVVAFTSTDCSTCRKVMGRLGALGVPVREVTHELEPGVLEAAGVEGVPLVVVLSPTGEPSAQFGGNVSRRRLRRAVEHAGW